MCISNIKIIKNLRQFSLCSKVPVMYISIRVSSSSSAYRKRCCKDRPIRFIFSRPFSSLGTHRTHTFLNFKWSYITLHSKSREDPSAVTTLSVVILLSVRTNSSTGYTGGTWWGIICNFYKRPWENFSVQLWNTLRGKHFPH
jgi:hypothetical protein